MYSNQQLPQSSMHASVPYGQVPAGMMPVVSMVCILFLYARLILCFVSYDRHETVSYLQKYLSVNSNLLGWVCSVKRGHFSELMEFSFGTRELESCF